MREESVAAVDGREGDDECGFGEVAVGAGNGGKGEG